jgi:PAS domain-containing protein
MSTSPLTQLLAKSIIQEFLNSLLFDPKGLGVFERLYELHGPEAVKANPRFQDLVMDLQNLILTFFDDEGSGLEQLALRMITRHTQYGVGQPDFFAGLDRLEEIVKEQALGFLPTFQRNARRLRNVAVSHFEVGQRMRNEQILRDVLERVDVGVTIGDGSEGKLYFVNSAYAALKGKSQEEILKEGWLSSKENHRVIETRRSIVEGMLEQARL